MKDLVGSPGSVSGLFLRLGQCLFAAGSMAVMVSASGFSNYTAFWYICLSLLVFLSHFSCCGSFDYEVQCLFTLYTYAALSDKFMNITEDC